MTSITKTVAEQKTLTSMKKALAAAGLNDLLEGKESYTVLAPSDVAFGKLAVGALDELLKPENKEKLVDLLKHHIIKGKVAFKDLQEGDKLTTLDGAKHAVNKDNGRISIDGAIIQTRDLETSNGTIHFLDRILLN